LRKQYPGALLCAACLYPGALLCAEKFPGCKQYPGALLCAACLCPGALLCAEKFPGCNDILVRCCALRACILVRCCLLRNFLVVNDILVRCCALHACILVRCCALRSLLVYTFGTHNARVVKQHVHYSYNAAEYTSYTTTLLSVSLGHPEDCETRRKDPVRYTNCAHNSFGTY
jgi:hypothetical protein